MTVLNLGERYTRFRDLITLAEEYFLAGSFPAAAGLAQIAARCAFPDHAGLFTSPRLERLLLALGKTIPPIPARGARNRDSGKRNILHVLTYGRPVGGDTRFVWRWVQEDCGNRHSVAITTQSHMKDVYNVPETLRDAVESSGGFLRTLRASASKPLQQAQELRNLCREMDIVVLHLWPYDIVPVLALAAGCDSVKTLFVNHSDHTFWVGASVAHLIAHLRRQPLQFSEKRRGLNSDHSEILPIPMIHSPSTLTREQAKRALGYGPDTVLLLTIASPFKYSFPGQISFLDLVTPVLVRSPQAVLLAVGPQSSGAWQSASIQTNGRIVPLGARQDNDLLRVAADIYLDSIPFSSITSLLESGICGVPLLGYDLPDSELKLLGPGAPGLEKAMELADNPESYQNLLNRLINDAGFRQQSGKRVQQEILSAHTGRNWIQTVHDLYARVDRENGRGCFLKNDDVFDTGALDAALVRLYAHAYEPRHTHRLIRNYVGANAYASRLSLTWRLHRMGFDVSYLNLLPPPVNALARAMGRSAKRFIRRMGSPR